MKQRNKKIPGDKPQWMVMEEEDIENERNRRIGLRLVGRMTPGREVHRREDEEGLFEIWKTISRNMTSAEHFYRC